MNTDTSSASRRQIIGDEGQVHINAAEAEIRLPNTTRHVRALVLGVRTRSDGLVDIYLDRLVHPPTQSYVGPYSVWGGVTTILTGPAPLSSESASSANVGAAASTSFPA